MELKLNSGLFHVTPPCCYWVFAEYLESIVQYEQDYHDELMEDELRIYDDGGQLALNGKPAYRLVRRCDLPKDHDQYVGPERCELDWQAAKEFIARCWLAAFDETVLARESETGCALGVETAFEGVWSPKEYNWSHDVCDFIMCIPREGMDRVIAHALNENRDGFARYVREHYRSCDGFISHLPSWIDAYDELREKDRVGAGVDEVEHLYWACLNFFLFGYNADADYFTKRLWWEAEDAPEKLFGAITWEAVEDTEAVI